MRRVICFLLVLVFCVSLACPAYATTNSAGDSGRPVTKPGENPKNGDIIMRYVIIMIVSLIALIAVIVIYRKMIMK